MLDNLFPLLVADKGGALFPIELEEDSVSSIQVGALRHRIRTQRREEYDKEDGWKFIGGMAKAKDDELVRKYVNLEKKESVFIARSWKSWYGTFVEDHLLRRFPTMSPLVRNIIRFTFSLVFVGIIIGFSQASFTIGDKDIPYTLQTLGIFYAAFFLGIWSVVSVAIYLVFGASGLPVFAGHSGGALQLVDSYSSGFLWGFLIASFVVGLMVSWRGWDRNVYTWFLACCLGWVCVFVPGIVFFASMIKWDWSVAFYQGLVLFLPAEAIKFVIIMSSIPLTWFGTTRLLNTRNSRFLSDVKAFFNPRLISF